MASSLFKGLTEVEFANLLASASVLKIPEEEYLFRSGDPSDALYILITGELEVRSNDNVLATISEISVVGEIGVFTNTSRTASVRAAKNAIFYKIPAEKIHALIDQEVLIGFKLYRNVTKILSERLQNGNLLIEFYDINKADI